MAGDTAGRAGDAGGVTTATDSSVPTGIFASEMCDESCSAIAAIAATASRTACIVASCAALRTPCLKRPFVAPLCSALCRSRGFSPG